MSLLSACNSDTVDLQPPEDGALRVATYNVHYIDLTKQHGTWSLDGWERRKEPLDLAFKDLHADVVAFQEMESFTGGNDGSINLTLDWLLSRNAGYAAAAVGDWREFPSTQPILYRTERLSLKNHGWFFFSDTPDTIYSPTFNGSYPAFASWAEFEEIGSGKSFHVYTVHFEFKNFENRRRSAELVASRLAPLVDTGERVFLLGDLNALHGWKPMQILETSGLRFMDPKGATWHVNRGWNLFGAIDHLGFSSGISDARDPVVIRKRYYGTWPSDHYPVVGDFHLR